MADNRKVKMARTNHYWGKRKSIFLKIDQINIVIKLFTKKVASVNGSSQQNGLNVLEEVLYLSKKWLK